MEKSILDQIYAKYGEIPRINRLRNSKLDQYIIIDKLGSGSFGQVYNGYFRDVSGIYYVIIKLTQ